MNGVMEGKVRVAKASGLMGANAMAVATTGSIHEGWSCCRGSREQREEAD